MCTLRPLRAILRLRSCSNTGSGGDWSAPTWLCCAARAETEPTWAAESFGTPRMRAVSAGTAREGGIGSSGLDMTQFLLCELERDVVVVLRGGARRVVHAQRLAVGLGLGH